MTKHLSTQELEQHRARTLAPEELLRVDGHLSACDSCHQRFADLAELPEATMPIALPRGLDQDDASPHPRYEQFAAYIDGTMGEVDREIADSHLLVCVQCADEIRELRAFSQQISQQPVKAVVKSSHTPGRWREWFSTFGPLRAATVAAAIVFVVATVWIIRRTGLQETQPQVAQAPAANGSNIQPANSNQALPGERTIPKDATQSDNGSLASANTTENGNKTSKFGQRSTETNPRPPVTIALNDGARKITLDWHGNLAGLESLPPATQRAVRDALINKKVNRPSPGNDLSGQNITLLDTAAEGVPFALIGPTGIIVQSAQPTLRWRPLKGATGYVAAIFDENFKRVATSEQLSAAEWTPPRALARGRIYSWQVTAFKNGQEIVSPVPPAPEARFKVLEAAQAEEIERARKLAQGSHLTLGVIYARAGLFNEAEKEFQELVRKNPDSPVARKLLNSLQAWQRK
jgi:hypothetical protein